MPKCAWILLGAIAALLHTLGLLGAAANVVLAVAHYAVTEPPGLALVASLALWHLSTHTPKALRRQAAHTTAH